MRITQDAIKRFIYKNKKEISETRNDLLAMLDSLIPSVGDIEINISGINPGTKYVGTRWEIWGSGRVPVGINTSDTDFNTPEKTGGTKTHTLTTAQLPAHAHQVGAHAHGLNSHTHTIPTQTVTSAVQSGTPPHSIPQLKGSAASGGGHIHDVKLLYLQKATQSGSNQNWISSTGDRVGHAHPGAAQEAGAHTHSVTTDASTSGNDSGTHTHSVTIPQTTSGAASGSTANSAAFNTGNTGSGNAHNNLQPYITCYMWKRVA